jgi:phosphate-selective porin OprO/OprP
VYNPSDQAQAEAPTVVWENGQLDVGGELQTDGRFFLRSGGAPGTDTFLLRRARPLIQGTFYGWLDFRLMPDFGQGQSVIQDAYLDAHLWGSAVQARVGKYKTPIGLEELQVDSNILFLERAFPSDLVANRDVGVELHGTPGGVVEYAAGVFNGVPDGANGDLDTNDSKDGAGRILLRPFARTGIAPIAGLRIGAGGSWGRETGITNTPNLPTFKTSGQVTFFSYLGGAAPVLADGRHYRLAPQLYYSCGPFSLLAEYTRSTQEVAKPPATATLTHKGWQVAGSFVLFGGDASYEGAKPETPFSPGTGGAGALEIAARYSEIRFDGAAFPTFADPAASASAAREVAGGVSWYVNDNVRLMLDFARTTFVGGAPGGANRAPENLIFGRLQLAI